MSSDPPSFQTAEDELNFILGNDVDDCDVGGDALFEEFAGLTAAAAAHDGPVGADAVADFAAGFGAATSHTQGGSPSKQALARKVSLCPPSTRATLLPTNYGAAFQDEDCSEPLIFQDALPPLDFDLADDDMLLFPHAMSDAPPARGSGTQPFPPSVPEGGFGALFDRQESEATFGRLGLFHRPPVKPVVAPLVHAPVTPTPTKKKAPPLVVHPHPPPPSYAHSQSKRPLRKRQVQVQSVSPFPEPDATTLRFSLNVEEAHKAADAREARAHRRIKRAKGQAVNLVGGGDAAEVRAQAAADVLRAVADEQELLAEFSKNFDPAAFVRANVEQVYEALAEASEVQEKQALEAASKAAVATAEVAVEVPPAPGHAPTIEPLQLLPAVSLEEEDAPAPTPSVVTPTASKLPTKPPAMAPPPPTNKPVHPLVSINDKVLPSGKDPASRRLRRLMRNRLSAQASRDRRKKAIEEMQQTKAQKDLEIRELQRAVEEEARRLQLWQQAVGRARERLRARDCAKEAGAPSRQGTRASKKARC